MGKNKEKLSLEKKDMTLDQFFTKPDVAKRLYDVVGENVDFDSFDVFLEPSVGVNSFGSNFPPNKGVLMDIDPKQNVFWYNQKTQKHEIVKAKDKKINIIQMDFLSLGDSIDTLGLFPNKKIVVIGNPPFGQGSSLAVKFFNICAKISNTICFIVPRTFKRVSIQNRLDLNFHLIYNEDLPYSSADCIFEPVMNAKCCMQIWQRSEKKRTLVKLASTHRDWEFLPLGPLKDRKGCENKQPTPPPNADFAMKAYGSNCGEIVTEGLADLRPKSWHWFKCKDSEKLIKRFNQLDYSISEDAVRQSSIGRKDLIEIYTKKFGK
jgi:hypothetical protein